MDFLDGFSEFTFGREVPGNETAKPRGRFAIRPRGGVALSFGSGLGLRGRLSAGGEYLADAAQGAENAAGLEGEEYLGRLTTRDLLEGFEVLQGDEIARGVALAQRPCREI